MIATYEDNDFEHSLVDSKLQNVYSLQYHSWAVALNRYSSFSSVDQRGYGSYFSAESKINCYVVAVNKCSLDI